ncbi:RDD family protein [Methanocrinis sp.]|uniref:RDD family protein n=1 Tax=Methanocrinis sp. TaxID=3101522 RepID=UPI003D0FA3B8
MDEAVSQADKADLDLAGVGQRLASYLVDVVVLSVIYIALIFLSGVQIEEEAIAGGDFSMTFIAVYILMAAIAIGYYTYFFGKGQTPGMKLVEVKLIRTDGVEPVGYKKGFFRWIGMEISGMVLFLGYVWILIDKKRQGWHDKIAGTYVVKA